METLNLSESTPRSENRAKTLFWPTIENEIDVDTVTRQGFWLCFVVGVFSVIFNLSQGDAVSALMEGSFFLLAGVGVRRRSIAAAIGAFIVYSLTTLILLKLGQFGVVRIFMMALLLANVRGTWLSAKLRRTATEPPPVPQEGGLADKLCDQWPIAIWPWGRWLFYVLLPIMVILMTIAAFVPADLLKQQIPQP
jgi:hypothetical protein